jgi:hypothetical protein
LWDLRNIPDYSDYYIEKKKEEFSVIKQEKAVAKMQKKKKVIKRLVARLILRLIIRLVILLK